MIDFNPNDLIDREIAANANAKLQAVEGRLNTARAALASAEAEQKASWDASMADVVSAATGEEIDPMAGAAAYQAATAKCVFAARLCDVLEDQLANVRQEHAAAHSESFRPLETKGRELRLSASIAGDRARAALAEADALNQQGTRMILQAYAAHLPRSFDGNRLEGPVKTEAEEREIWA